MRGPARAVACAAPVVEVPLKAAALTPQRAARAARAAGSSRCCSRTRARRLDTPPAAWTAHGRSGAFAGGADEHYAVLSNSGAAVRVYATAPSQGAPAALRRLELPGAGALALFPAPAWPSLPRCARRASWHLACLRDTPESR